MPRYVRPALPGSSIFSTVALADRRSDLLVREVTALRRAVRATLRGRPFAIDAWVVLPDPLHAVWTLPEGDADHSTRWKAIRTRFTKSVGPTGRRSTSKIAKGEAGLWQRRFREHHIWDRADLDAHVRHCWINPVKHGLAARAVDWPYSSIHRDIARGIVEPEWSGTVPDGSFGE